MAPGGLVGEPVTPGVAPGGLVGEPVTPGVAPGQPGRNRVWRRDATGRLQIWPRLALA